MSAPGKSKFVITVQPVEKTIRKKQIESALANRDIDVLGPIEDTEESNEDKGLLEGEASPDKSTNRGILDLVLMVWLAIDEGLIIGYIGSLLAIFTEMKVPAVNRSVLNFTMAPMVLRVVFAPIVDRYYIPWLGRRKTYIIPCKLLSALFYLILSSSIDDLVLNKSVWTISLSFFCLCLLLCFENNAVIGLRREYFGRGHSGYIGASHNMAVMIGITIGMQMFTALNSRSICRNYLFLSDRLLTHRGYMYLISFINISSLLVFLHIREDPVPGSQSQWPDNTNFVVVFNSIFSQHLVRRLLIFQIFQAVTLMTMKSLSTQYYISKGIDREHVILLNLLLLPFVILGNIMWIKYTRSKGIINMAWTFCTVSAIILFLHAPNLMMHSKKAYPRTLTTLAFINCLDICTPWTMFQSAVTSRTASRKYASSYMCAFSSILASSRYIVLYLVNPLIDHYNIFIVYGLLTLLQLSINALLYNESNDLDSESTEEFKLQFERGMMGKSRLVRSTTI